MILDGKTLIVSGVGTGLGSEIARLAIRDGANVVLAARTAKTLEAVAAQVDPGGDRVASVPTDITDAEQCDALARTAVERFGGVDAIAQVAALSDTFGGLEEATREDWMRNHETNVVGSLQVCRAAARQMKARGGGSIVLIGSQSSFLPQVPQIAYASSKGALRSAMFFMAKELGPDRIRVNTVVPTWMWGPPVEGFVNSQASQRGVSADEVIAEITAGMPLGEIPKDDDVAEAVVFLASERARMITGQCLLVNAGELMT
ncbi:MAG: SDR family oxidoreductase [Proteobacteria bacterium]|nr:SDR family oxidoreductase [Pseudomonadota bacterium]